MSHSVLVALEERSALSLSVRMKRSVTHLDSGSPKV